MRSFGSAWSVASSWNSCGASAVFHFDYRTGAGVRELAERHMVVTGFLSANAAETSQDG